jgi:hypothetical protein
LPGWEEVTVHEPAPVRCTVEALTVQLPLAAKETVSPEDALALTAKSGSPYVLFASGPNAIVWPALAIEKLCETGVAGM